MKIETFFERFQDALEIQFAQESEAISAALGEKNFPEVHALQEKTREILAQIEVMTGFSGEISKRFEELGINSPEVDEESLFPEVFKPVEKVVFPPESEESTPETHKASPTERVPLPKKKKDQERVKKEESKALPAMVYHLEGKTIIVGKRKIKLYKRLGKNQLKLLETLNQAEAPLPGKEIMERMPRLKKLTAVTNLVTRLRRVIESEPQKPELLVNIPGEGYQLMADLQVVESSELIAPLPPKQAEKTGPDQKVGLTSLSEAIRVTRIEAHRTWVGKYWVKNKNLMTEGVHYYLSSTGRIAGLSPEGQQRLALLGLIHAQLKEKKGDGRVSSQKLEQTLDEVISNSVSPTRAGQLTGLGRGKIDLLRKKGILREGIDFFSRGNRTKITPYGLETLREIKAGFVRNNRVNYQRAENWAHRRDQPEKVPDDLKDIEFEKLETVKLGYRIRQYDRQNEGELNPELVVSASKVWEDYFNSGGRIENCEKIIERLEDKLTTLSENPGAVLPRYLESNQLVLGILMKLQAKTQIERAQFIQKLIHGKPIPLKQEKPGDPVERLNYLTDES